VRAVNVVLGGPWYGSKVDARLLQACVQFACAAPDLGVFVREVVYEDGMLDVSRNRLLARAIATGADWLLSVDADCSFQDQLEPLSQMLKRELLSEVALVGAPVKQGNGVWNVLDFGDQRLSAPPSVVGPVGSVGFGLVAFRCGWYAKNWPRQGSHFVPFFQSIVLPDPGKPWGMGAWGEDFGHCKAVRDRGGKVMVDPKIRVRHHVVRPGHPAAKDE
jgi:hypothetical protein